MFPSSFSISTVLFHVFFGLPLSRHLWGVHLRAFIVILLPAFLTVCPIQVHFLRVIVVSMESCRALVFLSFQLMLKILLKQLLMKTWILRCSCLVVFQVSNPYNSTDFTLELKIFSLVSLEMFLDFHNLSNMWNATLAFPSLALTSSLLM